MVAEQLAGRGVTDARVLQAMRTVPRERFLPDELRELAYADRAVAIKCGQTISQPVIVGLMTQALQLRGREHVLEVGTGSGYQTALLAELAEDVVSVERHAELSRRAGAVLGELGYENVELRVGDGWQGAPDRAPFDCILVAAAADICPPALAEQLAEGGVLVIPQGDAAAQTLVAYHKVGGVLHPQPLTRCRFVPLVPGLPPAGPDRPGTGRPC
jgi:protein-L-isoaspartate(D-aspartate) O-methyltransferase